MLLKTLQSLHCSLPVHFMITHCTSGQQNCRQDSSDNAVYIDHTCETVLVFCLLHFINNGLHSKTSTFITQLYVHNFCYDGLCFFGGGSASLLSLSEFLLSDEQLLLPVFSSFRLSFLAKWNDHRASSTLWGVQVLSVGCCSVCLKKISKKIIKVGLFLNSYPIC